MGLIVRVLGGAPIKHIRSRCLRLADASAPETRAKAGRGMGTLGLEPLFLPCSGMKCGDIVYRSTLDPVLRLEQGGITALGAVLLGAAGAYLFLKPGILRGFVDYYALALIDRGFFRKALAPEDLKLGRILGRGGFGNAYKAVKRDSGEAVVVKVTREFGMAEVWMNERLQRNCPKVAADFITAFEENDRKGAGKSRSNPLWLVWSYEGDYTLDAKMAEKDFPFNMEGVLGGSAGGGRREARTTRRRAQLIRGMMQQLLTGLSAMHSIGIVHRDIKPQNIIVSESDARLKYIDFGAAADLLVGINYTPDEYLLDPRYAAPERYIMSQSTPKAPSAPFAAFLSPVLWMMNQPDRFDMYSMGLIFMQMVFAPLRKENTFAQFSRTMQKLNYDVGAWKVRGRSGAPRPGPTPRRGSRGRPAPIAPRRAPRIDRPTDRLTTPLTSPPARPRCGTRRRTRRGSR